MTDPVIEVRDERDGGLVYALRISGDSFRPMVFEEGAYTLKVGEPDRDEFRSFSGISPLKSGEESTITIEF
jgi:hypothetical protein